jgi:riboflavin kinase/FMN adenylyltransferase
MEVSSTRIRNLLKEHGDAAMAALLLGRPYKMTGMVVRGDARGRELGFPTANLRLSDARKLIPAHGVYAVRALLDGLRYDAMMNIGRRPTFGSHGVAVEVHLIGQTMELYGREISVELVARMRDEIRFDSREQLIRQLEADCAAALSMLGSKH